MTHEHFTVPLQPGADRFRKPECRGQLRHVQVGAGAEQNEEVTARAVLREALQRIRVQRVSGRPARELRRPGLQPRAPEAAEARVDEGGLERPVVGPPQEKAHGARQGAQQARQAPGMAQQVSHDVGQQGVAARDRTVKVEDRHQRLALDGNAPRRRGGGFAQAALPAAASCRSTYCRMPPWR